MKTGEAMDIRTGWNFDDQSERDRAMNYIRRNKPTMVVGSPVKRMFSEMQTRTQWNRKRKAEYENAVRHIEFVTEIYKEQLQNGRYFLHVHPADATSWKLKAIVDMEREKDVFVTMADQCMYGLSTKCKGGGTEPTKRKTRFMTNAECVADELSRKCNGDHVHQ